MSISLELKGDKLREFLQGATYLSGNKKYTCSAIANKFHFRANGDSFPCNSVCSLDLTEVSTENNND